MITAPQHAADGTEGARSHRSPAPAAIVIFGASGDLTHRKLMPALFSLACQGLLPPETAIVGAARTAMTDEQFRAHLRDGIGLAAAGQEGVRSWDRFAERISYVPVDFGDAGRYGALADHLAAIDAGRGTGGNRLFYLATAPEYFPVIAENLGRAHLADAGGGRFARLVVEKPFGTDLPSARALNDRLNGAFREEQVYRIDHYLGKETVQNLLVLRFGNAIFEPLWNRRYVDHVQITVAEDLGVGTRGGYYDQSGTLRDIVQNHLMQVLSLVAMEPPAHFGSREVHDEKVKVLRAITPFSPATAAIHAVRGQYSTGMIGGEPVPGYHQERGVASDSATETFVAMRLTIDNWRWSGTPFYLRTGKRLPHRTTEVAIQFKSPPHLPFDGAKTDLTEANLLTLRIQPNEGAALRFMAKVPGPRIELRPVEMDFTYQHAFDGTPPEAYERLLLDALLGDSTLFARWDEVERAWEILQPLIERWSATHTPFVNYAAGGWGPTAADDLIHRDGREWRQP